VELYLYYSLYVFMTRTEKTLYDVASHDKCFALSEECAQCPLILTFVIIIVVVVSLRYYDYSFFGFVLLGCSENTHKSLDHVWECVRKYWILTILKPFSVGKFMLCGCDLWKFREFLFPLKNLAPQM
jgi:hypothetical protein